MKRNLLVALMILGLPSIGLTQGDKGFMNEDEIKEKCQLVIDDFTNDELISAFEKLRQMWVLPEDELAYLEKHTIEQLNLVEDRFGTSIGNKLVKEGTIEDVLYRLTYVVKYQKHGLRVRFTFYSGKGGKWYLNNFKWDTELGLLFEEP